jgi:hypothetical protein
MRKPWCARLTLENPVMVIENGHSFLVSQWRMHE